MDWKSHFLKQTDYQLWANRVLFDTLARLEENVLSQPQGLFFGSIHHTTDHLLTVLEVWAARLRGETPQADLQRLYHPDWLELKHALQHALRAFRHWLENQPEEFFASRLRYARPGGEAQDNQVADLLTHLMHHFTHHRGQISAAATRLGAPAPEMDFLYYVRAMDQAARKNQAAQMQQ